ncbi:E3 ubiquitin/ISG15 ligase TRIM25 isoform X1 [Tachysurus fulvidraco]|uniref:E3 ubiquitin/ISG15 ligase TRIM25 isoform X1 n=1 Tax=Tachysurus fulvidraco TaxID=1234273 RepID=UPI001FEF652C|nr:E3 ubiquitin/ISG15 ligase TRIM25 isoform X1 [Tachysurus fulvidraco]XP_047669912.1 E3 ubiquitin/ISG15 ligase TRIM25 isoform X1 [Tachysurus fulvidraco]
MAEVTDAVALLSLEEDLTCSICLCPFNEPVSLNCGHSFCQTCLQETWSSTSSYFCPHCRTHYHTKPDLKKNTVLSAVVETFRAKAGTGSDEGTDGVFGAAGAMRLSRPEPKPIMCDMCTTVKAVKTCLTCITSFCSEHVRPHTENPLFRAHELCEPLSDLAERLCPEHGKLMEFFCARHERSICSSCLQQSHKECGFSTPSEQRTKIETDLRDKLNFLDGKTEKNQKVITEMREQQNRLKEMSVVRKRALEAEYQQIRDMLQRDEREAMDAVDKEMESGNTKLNTLIKKFNQNIQKMSSTRDEITNLLARSHSLDFLQASVELPSVVNFDPFSPRINLDSKRVIAYHSNIVNLKEQINKILREPVENRIFLLKPVPGKPGSGESETSCTGGGGASGNPPNPREPGPAPREDFGSQPKGGPGGSRRRPQPRDKKENRDHNERKDPRDHERKDPRDHERKDPKDHESKVHKVHKDPKAEKSRRGASKGMNSALSRSMDHLDMDMTIRPPVQVPVDSPPSTISHAIRSELLKYATMLTFDFRTAHKRVALSENNTKASVSDDPSPYPDIPPRFTVCSQVLCNQSFSHGRHYWEVKMSSNNFCGLGLAYGSIDRKGPSSRLGRNTQSWCIEWFNIKLSAWHNSSETVLTNPNPSRVGVLLDCDNCTATFYNVQDRAYPIHTFVFPFSQPVYPAFWIFSSGSSLTLCKLNN